MSRRSLKMLFYAINGLGLGHLTRLTALARDLKRLCEALDLRADIRFLTTSEAPWLSQDFPTYKLPSKSVFKANGLTGYTSQSKFFISNLVASFRPDLLVLDTQPEGSFQEFFFIRDYAARTVFIDRHKDATQALSPSHISHLELYDLILVPDHEHAAEDYPLPERCQGRRRFIGPVSHYEGGSSSAELRQYFGFDQPWPVIYLSAGGGGDKQLEAQMNVLIDGLLADECYLLAGYGPLYHGPKRYGPRIIPLTDTHISHWFSGVDYAVSAAGYNSYQELLAAGVPTLFFAQARGLDRQDLRIEAGLAQGWHEVLHELSPEALKSGLERLKTGAAGLRERLSQRPAPLGSRYGAYEILKLHASLTGSPVELQTLALAADSLRESAADDFGEVYRWLSFCRRQLLSETERQILSERALVHLATRAESLTRHERFWPLAQALRRLRQHYSWSEAMLQSVMKRWLPDTSGQLPEDLEALTESLTLMADSQLQPLLLESWLRVCGQACQTSRQMSALTQGLIVSGQFRERLEWLIRADGADILPYFKTLLEDL